MESMVINAMVNLLSKSYILAAYQQVHSLVDYIYNLGILLVQRQIVSVFFRHRLEVDIQQLIM